MKNEISFAINWPIYELNRYKKTWSVEFSLVAQTQDLAIEKEVLKSWPNLMHAHEFSQQENLQLHAMRKYIKKNLKKSEIDQLFQFFKKKGFTDPIAESDNIFNIEVTGYNAAIWGDRQGIPHLELKCKISVDVGKMVKLYTNRSYIKLSKNKSKLFSDHFILEQLKKFPLIIHYKENTELNRMVESLILKEINDQQSVLYTNLNKVYKQKKFHLFDKRITKQSDQFYKIEFTKTSEVLSMRTQGHTLMKTAAAGYVLNAFAQNRRKEKLKQLLTAKADLMKAQYYMNKR